MSSSNNNSNTLPKARTRNSIILSGTVGGLLYFFVLAAIGFINVRVVLTYLPDEDAGIWFILLNFLAYIALLDFGVGTTLARRISFALGGKYPDGWEQGAARKEYEQSDVAIADLISSVAALYTRFSLIAGLLIWIVGFFSLPVIVKRDASFELVIVWSLIVMSGIVLLMTIAPSAALMGQHKLHYHQLIGATMRIMGFVLIATFLSRGWGLVGIAIAVFCENCAKWLTSWFFVQRINPLLKIRGLADKKLKIVNEMIGPSIRMGIMTLTTSIVLQTDNTVISLHMGPEAVTNYNIAFQLAYMLFSVALVFAVPLVAVSAQAYAQEDHAQVEALLSYNLRFSMAFISVGAIMLFVWAPEVIQLWVGDGKFIGASVLGLILVVMLFETQTTVYFRVITASGKIPFVPYAIAAAVLNLIISYTLVGYIGWYGVVFGSLISQGVTTYWIIPVYTHRALKISGLAYLRWLLPVLILSVWTFLCAEGIHRWLAKFIDGGTANLASVFVVGLFLSGILIVIGFICIVLSARERAFMREQLNIHLLQRFA